METQTPIQSVSPKKSKLPIIIGVAVGILLCCCVLVVAVLALNWNSLSNFIKGGGETYSGRADEILRADALNLIGLYEEAKLGCADLSLVSGRMLLSPDQTGNGSWQEAWQVNACGNTHGYTVTFTPTPDSGTDISILPAGQ
jgi:hypothetical protein